ncbi:MAG: acyl-CoA dehydrogenase family protein [Actinomycetota bacterium]
MSDAFALSREDLVIQAKARAFADELIPHEVTAELNDGFLPEELAQKHAQMAIDLGLSSMNMPKELGGGGLTMLQQVLVSEQIGRVTNALAWVVATPAAWVAEVATRHQLETWVLPTIRGERHECYAITEENAGSDVDAIEATAIPDGEQYVLNGVKWHVTSANLTDYCFFQAKLPGGEHLMFFVDLDTPGISTVRTPMYSHTYAHHHPIMAFEDVRVPAANLIGDEGDGMRYTHEWFRYERIMIAARCCGATERLIDEASKFAQQRRAFGKPISDYQSIQFMLADSLTELWAARLMTYGIAREVDANADVKLQHAHCSMVKLFASEMANRVADRAVQIFGGRGYMRENVAERFFRELRVDRIWEGTSEIQRVIIADQLYKRGIGLAGASGTTEEESS